MTAGEAAQQRDLETLARLPPSHSDPSGWVPQTQRTLFWTRASLITEAQAGERETGLKRRGGKRLGAKRGPGKDECQLCPQCPSQIPPSFPSSSPSILSLPLLPSSWPVFTLAVNDFSEGADWDISVFKLKQASLFKLSMNWHPLSPLSLSHVVLSAYPRSLSPLCTNSFSSCNSPPWFSLSLLCIFFLFHLSLRFYPLPLLDQLSLLSPVSLDRPSSPVLIDLEWHAAEAMGAVLLGRSICTDMERLQHQLDSQSEQWLAAGY